MSGEIPAIDNSVLPAAVRNGTTAQQQTYKTALTFERQLVGQLTQQLADSAAPADDGSDSTDDGAGASMSSNTDAYTQMLPGVLADSIMKSGGLGLAQQLYDNMQKGAAA
jgi:Rod binding domain-containing protein